MNSVPIVCDVCLVGGGHSHVLLIRRWAMRPLPGVRLTLVSSTVQTPYSGMLPGLIAGHYNVDDIHVDLRRLCAWAGVRFVEHTLTSLNLETRQVQFDDRRPALGFDVLSLDTGSTPDLSVTGSREHVTPVKPVHDFHARWQALRDRLCRPGADFASIGVVGSGAGGFEIAAAMRHVLPVQRASISWFLRGELPLSGRPPRVGQLALAAAIRDGIRVITGFDVVRVDAGKLNAADGRVVELDEILWCTAATGPAWPEAAGLSVDHRGFVSTNSCLQSISHEFIFATGDIGTQVDTPSAKAGVYAVRQAPYLYENLRRYILGDTLKTYRPQKDFLSLMATGGKRAIASRGPVAIEADWIWRWKDHIDQAFMRKFRDLPVMSSNTTLHRLPDVLKRRYEAGTQTASSTLAASSTTTTKTPARPATMRCRGCGSKVGEQVLERVLRSVGSSTRQDGSLMYSPAGDTAVLDIQGGTLVQSIDHINAIVDDPYLLGRIAALHALSDVVTVDARVHSAQIIATVPTATEAIVERDLKLLMSGLTEALAEEHCLLAGGHTVEGGELSIGVVVNAVLNPQTDDISQQSPVGIGDVLILTQPLGIGCLFAGLMQQKARGKDISAAMTYMLHSNRQAADILRAAGSRYMTDVTGFGLLGHMERLLQGLQLGASVHVQQVPLIQGALALAEQGVRSSLWPQNRQVLDTIAMDPAIAEYWLAILCDPQTGGGLLAIVPAARSDECIQALRFAGYSEAAAIGEIDKTSALLLD